MTNLNWLKLYTYKVVPIAGLLSLFAILVGCLVYIWGDSTFGAHIMESGLACVIFFFVVEICLLQALHG